MKTLIFKVGIIGLSLFLFSTASFAAVRMVPRTLFGQYDLVYIGSAENDSHQIYRCPTTRKCELNSECVTQAKYWKCEFVYQAHKKELCRYYIAGSRAYQMTKQIAEELLGDLILDQIAFFENGAGLIYDQIADVFDAYEIVSNFLEINCDSNGLGQVLNPIHEGQLVIIREKHKGDVRQMLAVFNSKNATPIGGHFPIDYQNQNKLRPLKKVQLTPAKLE